MRSTTNASGEMDEHDMESWARTHEFAALSEEQQWHVVATLGSREAYDRMRHALLGAGPALADESARLVPDPATATRLHAALARRHATATDARMPFMERLFSYRIPAYQGLVGAVALAGLALFFLAPRLTVPGPERIVERVVQMPARETVRVQALDAATLQRITDSVHREVLATLAAERRTDLRRTAVAEQRRNEQERAPEQTPDAGGEHDFASIQTGPNKFVGLANLSGLDQQKRGKSLSEDSAFRRFAVTVSSDR